MTLPSGLVLGIDIGGTSVKAVLMSGEKMIASGKSEAYDRPGRGRLIEAVRSACSGMDVHGCAVGLCAPGAWDDVTMSVAQSAHVPGIVGIPLDDLVEESLGLRAGVRVSTDAHAAAYDVWKSERLRGRLLAISIGTGVGAAVLDDGHLLRVSGRSSGHMGQWDVSLEGECGDTPIGPDGGRGALEAYLGAAALRRRYGDDLSGFAMRLNPNDPPLRALARALRIAHAVYRPDHVRLLGGLGVRLGERVAHIHSLVCDQLTSLARPGWSLIAGRDDFHAARGAAALVAESPGIAE